MLSRVGLQRSAINTANELLAISTQSIVKYPSHVLTLIPSRHLMEIDFPPPSPEVGIGLLLSGLVPGFYHSRGRRDSVETFLSSKITILKTIPGLPMSF